MSTDNLTWQFTVDDFLRMGETGIIGPDVRVELVEGEVRVMSPIGIKHMGTLNWLNGNFSSQLAGKAIVSLQNPVQLEKKTQLQPDVAVLKYRGDCYLGKMPAPSDVLLLVEVADSSLAYDCGEKKKLYAKSGIVEYWVVDLLSNRLIWYSQPNDGEYEMQRSFSPQDRVQITIAEESLEFDFSPIFR